MKKLFVFVILILLILNSCNNTEIKHTKTHQINTTTQNFLIKGKVFNTSDSIWRFALTNFINNKEFVVNIQKDGSFSKLVPIEGMQDIYLYLNNDAITIYAQPNDTIEIQWDEKNFRESFEIKSPQYYRNLDLHLNIKLYNKFRQAQLSISQKLWEENDKENSIKYKWINDQFNQELKVVLDDSLNFTSNTAKFINQLYFFYTGLLLEHKLLNKYSLTFPQNRFLSDSQYNIPEYSYYKTLDNAIFYQCPEYRSFLFNYIRFSDKLFVITNANVSTTATGDTIIPIYGCNKYYDKKSEVIKSSSALDDYYNGLSQINLISIRDWYITKSILFSFEFYSFNEAEYALLDFLPKCKMSVYKDTLESFYSLIKKFKPGRPAPEFTLKDENNKSISLSSFKGKVIYLDFWGVGCGPCRYDIKNFIPKLHEKYRNKDVVFINICVDVNEEHWKKTISEEKLEGVNLLAEGWTNNQVCKDYNINAIPHYILIDKNGNFIESNAQRPYELIGNNENTIDKILKNN